MLQILGLKCGNMIHWNDSLMAQVYSTVLSITLSLEFLVNVLHTENPGNYDMLWIICFICSLAAGWAINITLVLQAPGGGWRPTSDVACSINKILPLVT